MTAFWLSAVTSKITSHHALSRPWIAALLLVMACETGTTAPPGAAEETDSPPAARPADSADERDPADTDQGSTEPTDTDAARPPDEPDSNLTILEADGSGDYPTIEAALAAGETNILLRAGDYYIDQALELTVAGTTLRGADRSNARIIATRNDQDLIISRADDTTVDNLTLDTELFGAAAFVQSGAHRTTLSNCTILGNDRIFTVYFAGPVIAAGDPTLDAWHTDALSSGNRMLGNDIRSAFVGDSVVFALQSDGVIRDNTIRNGMLAVYMTRRVSVTDNMLWNSFTHGLFVSLPSTDTTVTDNMFRSSKYSAISIRPQLEHPMAGRGFASTGIVIRGNDIEGEYTGIEVDGNGGDPTAVELLSADFSDNDIRLDDFMGVYIIRARAPRITDNTITFFGSDTSRRGVDGRGNIASSLSAGVSLVLEIDDAVITGNVITREAAVTDMSVMQNAVRLEYESVLNAQIEGNIFRRSVDDWLHSPCEADGGDVDANGIYDTTAANHQIAGNTCEVGL